MKIVVIDGQGGRLGKLLVEAVKDRIPQAEVLAVGTNGIATATMQKAGADYVATGENPVVRGVMDADVVLGPLGIVVAHSILGEVTPRIAEAVGSATTPAWRPRLAPVCWLVLAAPPEESETLYDIFGQHIFSSIISAPTASNCLAILTHPAAPRSPA